MKRSRRFLKKLNEILTVAGDDEIGGRAQKIGLLAEQIKLIHRLGDNGREEMHQRRPFTIPSVRCLWRPRDPEQSSPGVLPRPSASSRNGLSAPFRVRKARWNLRGPLHPARAGRRYPRARPGQPQSSNLRPPAPRHRSSPPSPILYSRRPLLRPPSTPAHALPPS